MNGIDKKAEKLINEKLEQSLRESENKFRSYIIQSLDGIFVTDAQGRYIEVNPSACTLLGYTEGELLKLNVRDISNSKDVNHFKNLIETGKSTGRTTLIKKDGQKIIVDINSVSLGNGKYIGFVRDVTEQKRVEDAVRQSEEYNGLILNGITDLVVLFQVENDSDFRFIKVNNSLLNTIDMTEEQVIGKLIEDVFPKTLVKTFKSNYLNVIKSKKTVTYEETVIYGTFETRLVPLFNFLGKCTNLIFTSRSITEKKVMENQIARLDRLNLVGEMAAGIGHEVRNPMTTVRGFLQLLANKANYAEDREHFDLMITEIDRANSIITEYLSLAKNKMLNLRSQNINHIINKLVPLLQANALISDKDIKLGLENIPDLVVDEKEISQLIINLVRNGFEATPSGGSVTIKTSIDRKEVILSVSDQGKGIPSEIMDKLGTPFVTTKENGTGLGLPICYSIATRHNATITVNTSPSGTTFFVHFKRETN